MIQASVRPFCRPCQRLGTWEKTMEYDWDKVDEAVLALLPLGLHDGFRAWKGFDWDAVDRLFEKGFIGDPRSKAKSIVFTEEGLERSRELFDRLFSRNQET